MRSRRTRRFIKECEALEVEGYVPISGQAVFRTGLLNVAYFAEPKRMAEVLDLQGRAMSSSAEAGDMLDSIFGQGGPIDGSSHAAGYE